MLKKPFVITAVILVLLLLVGITIAIIKWRRRRRHRKKRSERERHDNDGATDPFLNSNDDITREKQRNRMNHHQMNVNHHQQQQHANIVPPPPPSPRQRPPPLPARPVSYTPSNAESMNTLSTPHFDSARDYGSAADELENIGTLSQPIHIPEFLTNVDVDKPLQPQSPAPPPRNVHVDTLDPNYADYPDSK